MKKVVSFIAAAAMLTAGVNAKAEGTVSYEVSQGVQSSAPDYYTVFNDIEKYLAENGYPDYVAYLFNTGCETNGYDPSSGEEYQPAVTYHWEVGLANAGAAEKAEIEALLNGLYSGENVINFVECRYSHGEREALIPEIRDTVTSFYPDAEILDVINTNNPFVLVEVRGLDDAQMGDLQKRFGMAYGDLVIVSDGLDKVDDGDAMPGMGAATEPAIGEKDPVYGESAPGVGEIAAVAPGEKSADSTVLWISITAVLGLVIAAAVIFRAKLVPVFATSHGDVTAHKTVEQAVKNCEVTPDDSVLQAIKEELDK